MAILVTRVDTLRADSRQPPTWVARSLDGGDAGFAQGMASASSRSSIWERRSSPSSARSRLSAFCYQRFAFDDPGERCIDALPFVAELGEYGQNEAAATRLQAEARAWT